MKETSGKMFCGECGSTMLYTYDKWNDAHASCPKHNKICKDGEEYNFSFGDIPHLPMCYTCFSPLIMAWKSNGKEWYFTICTNPKCPDYEFVPSFDYTVGIIKYQKFERFFWNLEIGEIEVIWHNINDTLDNKSFLYQFVKNQLIHSIII